MHLGALLLLLWLHQKKLEYVMSMPALVDKVTVIPGAPPRLDPATAGS